MNIANLNDRVGYSTIFLNFSRTSRNDVAMLLRILNDVVAFSMAKVEFGGGVSQIRGSIAGQTFSRNGSGAYIRNKGVGYNSNTIAQQTVRSNFGGIASSWRNLSAGERQAWIDAAAAFPRVNSLGQVYYMSGLQLFQSTNTIALSLGQPLITAAPVPVDLAAMNTWATGATVGAGPAVTALTGGGTAIAGGVEVDTVPGGHNLIIEATAPLSKGIDKPKRPQYKRILVRDETESMSAVALLTAYTNVFGGAIPMNCKVFTRAYFVYPGTPQVSNSIESAVYIEV